MNKYYCLWIDRFESEEELDKFIEENKNNKDILVSSNDDYIFTRNISELNGLILEPLSEYVKCYDGGEYYRLPYGSYGGDVPISECINILSRRISDEKDEYILNEIDGCFNDGEKNIANVISRLIKEQMLIVIDMIISELEVTKKKIDENNFEWK